MKARIQRIICIVLLACIGGCLGIGLSAALAVVGNNGSN